MKSITQQIVELLGPPHCWHEFECVLDKFFVMCTCGHVFDVRFDYLKDHLDSNPNPNYETDPIALLKVMMEREDRDEFLVEQGVLSRHGSHLDMIPIVYLTTPGLLADAVVEYLQGRK